MTVRDVFYAQAVHCDDLGSPFTAGLCRLLGDQLDDRTAVGRLIHNWPGSANHRADAVPLRLCGGLHSLVLSGKSEALASHYPPHSNILPPYEIIGIALNEHEDYLLEWMKSPPQTNEVRRANMIWPGLCLLQERFGLPLSILEIGCSGGLNLQMDRFRYDLGGQTLGDVDGSLCLKPEWKGKLPPNTNAIIAERYGCDINPLDPLDAKDNLRLRSYIWADQNDRMERHDKAVEIMRLHPPTVERADAVSFIEKKLKDLPADRTSVIYSTITWQYLSDEDKAEGKRLIGEAGKTATDDAPLAWLRFEGDSGMPGGAITLMMWPNTKTADESIILGRADFHGRWVDWYGW